MSNTINVTISEKAVLAHALYEVIDKDYNICYFEDFVSHNPARETQIDYLLNCPSSYCNLHFMSGDNTEQRVNDEWTEFFENCDAPICVLTYFLRDLLHCLSEYNLEYVYEDTSKIVFENAGKILSIVQRYIDGETTPPITLLEELNETDFYNIGKCKTAEYVSGKVWTSTQTDDYNIFFNNLEGFEKGTIETISDTHKYKTNFNHIVFDGTTIIFYEMKRKDDTYDYTCNSRFILSPEDIKTIKIADTESTEESTYHIYLVTMSDGAEFMITTFYYR